MLPSIDYLKWLLDLNTFEGKARVIELSSFTCVELGLGGHEQILHNIDEKYTWRKLFLVEKIGVSMFQCFRSCPSCRKILSNLEKNYSLLGHSTSKISCSSEDWVSTLKVYAKWMPSS